MNNPIQMIVSNAMRGMSPMGMLKQMASSDPRAAQVMRMIDGKSGAQLADMVTGVAQNFGTTPDDVARSLGIPPRGVKK